MIIKNLHLTKCISSFNNTIDAVYMCLSDITISFWIRIVDILPHRHLTTIRKLMRNMRTKRQKWLNQVVGDNIYAHTNVLFLLSLVFMWCSRTSIIIISKITYKLTVGVVYKCTYFTWKKLFVSFYSYIKSFNIRIEFYRVAKYEPKSKRRNQFQPENSRNDSSCEYQKINMSKIKHPYLFYYLLKRSLLSPATHRTVQTRITSKTSTVKVVGLSFVTWDTFY